MDTGENSDSPLLLKDVEEKIIGESLETNDDKEIMQKDIDPENMIYEGLVFESEREAYEQYYSYALRVGFTVRKDKRYLRADGSVRSRYFVCYKEGERRKDRRYPKERKERIETRTGCRARMAVKNLNNIWVVSEIIHEHNHPLETPSNAAVINPDEKDRKIRDLTEELQQERRLRTAYQKLLSQVLKDVDDHTQNLTSKIELVVNNVKMFESEDDTNLDC